MNRPGRPWCCLLLDNYPNPDPYGTPNVYAAALLLHSELHPGDIHLDLVGLNDIGPLE